MRFAGKPKGEENYGNVSSTTREGVLAKKNTISSERAHQSAKIWSRLQLCEDPFEIKASRCFSIHMAPKSFTIMPKFGYKK